MAVMMRLDNRGHGMLAEYDPSDPASCAVAQKIFNDHIKLGYAWADISQNDGVFIKKFDPSVQEILAVPALVAG